MQGGRGTHFAGCHLPPGGNPQPMSTLANNRDDGGSFLFVLACGLVAAHSLSACAMCRCHGRHQLLREIIMKVMIPHDTVDISAFAMCHQYWCIIILVAEPKEYFILIAAGVITRARKAPAIRSPPVFCGLDLSRLLPPPPQQSFFVTGEYGFCSFVVFCC
jgi:hypothetical protein